MYRFDVSKPSLWCVFGKNSYLNLSRGDHIGEHRIVRLLSKAFNVYYNGVLVKEGDARIGSDKPVSMPEADYDLYYARNNPELFSLLPNPKICMAYPYDSGSFEEADALVVTTNAWKNVLRKEFVYEKERLFFENTYPKSFNLNKPVIQIKQYIDPLFSDQYTDNESQKVRDLKYLYTNAMSFGFFGRLAVDSLPIYAIEAIKRLSTGNEFATPITIFGGMIRSSLGGAENLPQPSVYIGDIPYQEVSKYIAAVSCTLAGEGIDDFVLGSNKVLDSIGLGIPVLGVNNRVRAEYLGNSYALLLNENSEDARVVKELTKTPSNPLLGVDLTAIKNMNTMKAAEIHLRKQMNSVFDWKL